MTTDVRRRDVVGRGLIAHAARLHMLVERELIRCLATHDLTRSEFDVLATLAGDPDPGAGLRPKDLSDRLLLTTGGLSNVLRRLEAADLVGRRVHTADGRGQEVTVTATGRAVVRQADAAVQWTIEMILAPVPYDALTTGLRALHTTLDTLGEDGPVHRPSPT